MCVRYTERERQSAAGRATETETNDRDRDRDQRQRPTRETNDRDRDQRPDRDHLVTYESAGLRADLRSALSNAILPFQ